ncbi:MAG: ATP-binding protein, partial [Acidobacteriaceae bacterium]
SVLDDMLDSPTIQALRITDLSGRTLAYSSHITAGVVPALTADEQKAAHPYFAARILNDSSRRMVAVANISVSGDPVALAWVYPDMSQDQVNLASLLRSAFMFALLAIFANALFSMLLARSVTRPLRGLLRGTKMLIRDPERSDVFPLKVRSINEAGELTRAFNTMVAALNEHRSGLNDTLALLDSMLANAPIGFAFFDSKCRYVRLNQFLAEIDDISIGRHLGRTVQDVFPGSTVGSMAVELEKAIEQVFSTGLPVRDLELRCELGRLPDHPRMWLVSLYPVRIGGEGAVADRLRGEPGSAAADPGPDNAEKAAAREAAPIRWVGAVIVDTTERKLSEEMLRRTEKLAATGRLAASIAHEINNPLEAVTNLLYLLHQQPLDAEAREYTEMAQQELARVSQITQQTLRFYRQSSKPVLVNPADVLDAVLSLHHGRVNAARVEVKRRYRAGGELQAFSGEIRQLFANLVGNALDAMPKGGRLFLSVRPSRAWNRPDTPGVRIAIADTGSGMNSEIRKRIFDAFFTTKEATGTGLGLWISSEIIAKHQGTVRVRSRPAAATRNNCRSGTVFMLFFPLEGVARATTEEKGTGSGNHRYL